MRYEALSTSGAGSLREPEIKAALIDALYAEGMIYGDAVVISEMPVASMSRRADIVVANGHLVCFEIKSDGDNTSRLSGQLEAYQRAFEGIVIVTGARHLTECLETTAPTVGVVVIDQTAECLPKTRMVRKPHLRRLSIDEALRQMRADELYRLAAQAEANPTGARDRYTLECLARGLPASVVRDAAINAIKARYRAPFQAFYSAREVAKSTLSALRHLRRPIANRTLAPKLEAPRCCLLDDGAELEKLSLMVRPRRHT